MKKTIISIVLTAAILLSVFAAVPFSASAAGTTYYPVSTTEELNAACEAINTNGGEATISLEADIIGAIDIQKDDAVVTVVGNGHTLTSPALDNVIYAENGAVINLGDGVSELTLTCSVVDPSDTNVVGDNPGVVHVTKSGVCNMYSKVTIKDHKSNNYLGGGVTVEGGTFTMYGGKIDNCGINGGSVCYGGGVAVFGEGSTFTMNGGEITNCYATTNHIDTDYPTCYSGVGGGVFVSGGSTFIMNGGTISGNTATNFGGGVAMMLGDMEAKKDPTTGETIINPETGKGYLDQGNPRSKVVINGGTISNNTAKNGAGVFASGIYYAFYHTLAAGVHSVGTPEDPGLYINGGANKNVEISSNTATENGGGVYVVGLKDTRKAQIYNAVIKNNTAEKGAGVINNRYWTQLDIDGCNITGNSATSNGGGVMALSNSDGGYTSIKDTTIKDNTSGDRGAGVYYDTVSKIQIEGADVIQDNTFDGKLNNLNILSRKKPVYVTGDLTGSQIGLSDPTLWDDSKEDTDADAVSTVRLTDGYKANNESLIPADAFTSDHESWYVDFGEKYTSDKTEYRYTAQKYENNLGLDEGYFVNLHEDGQNEFIKFDATTFSDNPKASTAFMTELDQRFRNEGYTFVQNYYYLGYSSYPGKIYKDPKSDVYIALLKVGDWTVYIYSSDDIDYLQNNIGGYSALQGAGNVQDYDGAENGKVVLVSHGYYDDDSLFSGVSASEEELVYDEPLDFEGAQTKTIYKINDYGFATTKYVIDGNSQDDGSYDYTSEVRLVRSTAPIKFHDNKNTVNKGEDKLFRVYNADANENYGEIENGRHDLNAKYQISPFYDIPSFAEDDYVFAGWYYHTDGNKDGDIPFKFDSTIPANLTDVYAHWIPVGKVDKAEEDDKVLPEAMGGKYRGFELFGVQIRPEYHYDSNYDGSMPGGLRFVASISEELLSKVDALSDKTTNGNNVEYGFVTASEDIVNTVTDDARFGIDKNTYKLQYKGENVNGVDTLLANATGDGRKTKNNFRYITNVDCTSKRGAYGGNNRIKDDHRNFNDYRLATYVVTYSDDASGENKGKNVAARAYMRYYDVNGLLRTFYNDYAGTSFYGGCSISFNHAEELSASNTNTAN